MRRGRPASPVQLFPVDIEHGFYDTLRGYDSFRNRICVSRTGVAVGGHGTRIL